MLKIEKLTDIRIVKVKPNLIRFYIGNKKYIMFEHTVLASGTEWLRTSIYEVRSDGLVEVAYKNECCETYEFIRDLSKRKATHLVYSNIDIEYFVKKLVENGLASYTPYDKELRDLRHLELAVNSEINDLQNLKMSAHRDWNRTSGRGLKVLRGLEIRRKNKYE